MCTYTLNLCMCTLVFSEELREAAAVYILTCIQEELKLFT